MDEKKARALANLIGGYCLNSGGGVWIVYLKREDDIVVAFTDEVVASYPDVDSIGNVDAIIDSIDLV